MVSAKNQVTTTKLPKYWSIRVVDIDRTNMYNHDFILDANCGPFKKHSPLKLIWSCHCSLFKAIRSIPSTQRVLTVVILRGHGCITKMKKTSNSHEEWHQLIQPDSKRTCKECKNKYVLFNDVVNAVEKSLANALLCYAPCRGAREGSDGQTDILEELKAHKFVLSTPRIGILYFTKQGSLAHSTAEKDPRRRTLLRALSLATQGGFGGTAEAIKQAIQRISSSEFSPRVPHKDLFDVDIHERWLA